MYPFNLYNSRVTYLPPPGYAPLFPCRPPLLCPSMLPGGGFPDLDESPLHNYVDDDGMHRVFIFERDFCPPNGSAVLRRCLLNVFLHSCKNKNTMTKEEEGRQAAAALGNEPPPAEKSTPTPAVEHPYNPAMAMFSSHLPSLFYHSYDEYCTLMRERLRYDAMAVSSSQSASSSSSSSSPTPSSKKKPNF